MSNHLDSQSGLQIRPLEQPGLGFAPELTAANRRTALPLYLIAAGVVLVAALAGWWWEGKHRAGATTGAVPAGGAGGPGGRGGMANLQVPIVPGVVEQKAVPIYLDGLGTVQAFNTVTVRSRVDGQVQRIAFVEGQDVKTGDLLAQIDPAPFQAQLDQNIAKKAQDEAQLAIARETLARDKDLLASHILSQQDYDTQSALADQYAAAVKGDEAAINSAKVQLAYTTITSPLDGRIGIRMVDQGNIVHASDASGLVVITQLRPISVVFTLPEQALQKINAHQTPGQPLPVFAVDRDNVTVISQGELSVIDNQIDPMTSTIRLKATFPNEDLKLWPGQFVNVRLRLYIRNGLVVPAPVIQRGPDGPFAFVISNDVAQVRPVKVAPQIEQNLALVEAGLEAGERVVVDGQYKLQAGSRVKLAEAAEPGPALGSGQKSDPAARGGEGRGKSKG